MKLYSENFRFIISVFEVKYGIPSDMHIIDKLRLFVKSDVYIIFYSLYDLTSYMWMSLGFRPSLNQESSQQERISYNLDILPPEIIKLVALYIPNANYLTRPLRNNNYIDVNNYCNRYLENSMNSNYSYCHRNVYYKRMRRIHNRSRPNNFSMAPLFTEGHTHRNIYQFNEYRSIIIPDNNMQQSHRHTMERLTRSRIRNMPYVRRNYPRCGV